MTAQFQNQIEWVEINSIHRHPRNTRKGNIPKIRESLHNHGFYKPLVVQKSTRFVIAGNHTREAALLEGYTEAPVVFLDVDDAKSLEILLVDNAASDDSTYDNVALAALLEEIKEKEGSLRGTGYDAKMLEKLQKGMKGAKDQSQSYTPTYVVLVECDDEAMQRQVIETMQAAGYSPKAMNS